jgi:hypothetical protein
MATFDIQYLINPTYGLLSELSTAIVGLSTAVTNNEILIETGFDNKQHALYDRLILDIQQAINIVEVTTRLLNKA